MAYQQIGTYKGDMYGVNKKVRIGDTDPLRNAGLYNGYEYDYEVPNNQLVASPGGVSSTQHHWTKGFYGRGGSSSDLYAGQGIRYLYGVKGNLYQQGDDALTQVGNVPPPMDIDYIRNEGTPYPGNITGDYQGIPVEWGVGGNRDNFEFDIPLGKHRGNLDSGLTPLGSKGDEDIKVRINPVTILTVIVIFYFALDFWTSAGNGWLSQRFNKGQPLKWQQSALFAVGLTLLFIVLIWVMNIPLVTIEGINV